MSQIFYDFSGGMESSAMLVVDRMRLQDTGAIVRWADTGKQFPEMEASIAQIEELLRIRIVRVPRRITFDEFLFERGGIIRKGTNDCSRRMKRTNLSRHAKTFPKPWEINLGYNAGETQRAEEWMDLNERPWCHCRFPLIESGINREATWDICRKAGFSILVGMYEKMGRFDCFMCGNQKPEQALKVVDNYPELAREWIEMEERKKHSFLPVSLKVLVENRNRQGMLELGTATACSCFGGTDDAFEDDKPADGAAKVRDGAGAQNTQPLHDAAGFGNSGGDDDR